MLTIPSKCPKCGSELRNIDEDLICLVCSSSKISNQELISLKFAMGDYTIYIDLDGVLVDFDRGFTELGKGDPESFKETHTDKEFWDAVREKPHFFLGLGWMPDGRELWNYVKGLNPIILTRVGPVPHCAQDKRDWVEKNLGSDIKIIPTTKKEKYANESSILIDDMEKNLYPWMDAGGISIKHTSAENTIKKLKYILDGNVKKKSKYKSLLTKDFLEYLIYLDLLRKLIWEYMRIPWRCSCPIR